jgi:hypothetical protein
MGLACAVVAPAVARAADVNPVELRWMGDAPPAVGQGVSWGVPWPRGQVTRDATFAATDSTGAAAPVQSWVTAYWPDGSVKWTGHAIAAPAGMTGPIKLSVGTSAAPDPSISVNADGAAIEVRNGQTSYRIGKSGSFLVQSVKVGDREVARDGRLVCVREDRSEDERARITREEDSVSQIASATVEQSGPVRAVVKIEGRHKATHGDRQWLPFTVRLYFSAGVDSVRLVHTFVFDGDQEKDFIKGIGVRFGVPMRQEYHNRHVRIVGEETGVFAEPVQVMVGRRNPSPELYKKQVEGKELPRLQELPGKDLVADMAVWDSYKLVQISPDGFYVRKRTNPKSAWIDAAGGKRSPGLAFVGDASGGLAIGVKDFWQSSPTAVEITGAGNDAAELTAWLWSPDAPAMDLRHYDVKAHGLEAAYEDIEEGFSTATGVARTHELTIRPFAAVPANEELVKLAKATAWPARLVCSPEYYHAAGVFGVWSLPDRSTPAKKWIEEQLDAGIAFYQRQIDQRRWYGFWDYGDVMHSYDPVRHEWKYDVGGFAWANTELMPDLWLWYSFMRTGRADVFRMAEAMTRHTQEVDVYHLGRFAGLGSRHNVRHWGCGAKELRIGQALLKRFYYYLTTDERTGDLIAEVADADYRMVDVDPLRKIEPKTQYPTHARVGPDWLAMCSNWLAAWERTGDTKYRDKILTGMKCVASFPHKFFSGDSYGYDPKTGMLYLLHPEQVAVPHLAALMGGPELAMEITPLLDVPEWSETWLHYCRYLQAPAEEQKQALGGTVNNGRGPHFSRMTAYAARVTKDPKLAARAWEEFLGPKGKRRGGHFDARKIAGPDVAVPIDEVPGVSTNDTAQWSLNAIELLELVGEYLPADAAPTAEGR